MIRRQCRRGATVGADNGFFSERFIEAIFDRHIEPHIAVDRGSQVAHERVRNRQATVGYQLSQRARKKIEELFGGAKDWHGLRRFRRRGSLPVRQEALLVGWILNLKRLAKLLPPAPAPA